MYTLISTTRGLRHFSPSAFFSFFCSPCPSLGQVTVLRRRLWAYVEDTEHFSLSPSSLFLSLPLLSFYLFLSLSPSLRSGFSLSALSVHGFPPPPHLYAFLVSSFSFFLLLLLLFISLFFLLSRRIAILLLSVAPPLLLRLLLLLPQGPHLTSRASRPR